MIPTGTIQRHCIIGKYIKLIYPTYFLSADWSRFFLLYFLFCLKGSFLFELFEFWDLYFSFNFWISDFCWDSVSSVGCEFCCLLGDFLVKYLSIHSWRFLPELFVLFWFGDVFFVGLRSGASPAKITLNLTLDIPYFSAIDAWKRFNLQSW